MPLQVDEGGGAVLRRLIERARRHGPHRAPARPRIAAQADGRRSRIELADGTPARRRRRRLRRRRPPARRARPRRPGCAVGERGGVVVDDACRTTDRARLRDRRGAPRSRAAATGWSPPATRWPRSSPTGCSAATPTFPGADLSTKLKLLGVDVASFGDAHRARRPARSRSCSRDPATGTYTKLVVSDDAQTLLGGILVGDARVRVAAPAGRPRAARRPGGADLARRAAAAAPARCPTTRRSARATTSRKGAICGAIAGRLHRPRRGQGVHQGRHHAAAPACRWSRSCSPTSGCRSCRTALCEHFEPVARRAVRDRRGRPASAPSRELDRRARHAAAAATSASPSSPRSWRRREPATSSTASRPRCRTPTTTSWPTCRRTAPTRSSRGSPAARSPRRSSSPSARSPSDFGLYTKITGGQRIDLFGARVEQLPAIWQRLVDAGFESGHAYGKSLRTVKSLRRLDLVPLRRAGLGRAGHRPGAALPRAALAAQDQARRLRLRPRVRRGPRQGRRRHRHRARAGTSTSAATAASRRGTPSCSPRTSTPRPWSAHRPVPHVLRPHRRPAAAHGAVGRGARGRPRPPRGGGRATTRSASAPTSTRRWPGTSTATRTSGPPCSTTRRSCAVRVVRQRARGAGPDDRLRLVGSAQGSRPARPALDPEALVTTPTCSSAPIDRRKERR